MDKITKRDARTIMFELAPFTKRIATLASGIVRFPNLRRLILKVFGITTPEKDGSLVVAGKRYRTNSQALQDVFVQMISNLHVSSSYLEIGAADPRKHSNTYQLEQAGWKGFSVEIDAIQVAKFRRARRNDVIGHDALKIDYKTELERRNCPKNMGYLQVDIEPPENSFAALKLLPLDAYKFAVITFEHDAYYAGNTIRDESRTLLKAFGYHLLIADVEVSPGNPFEDWYVHPELVGHDIRDYAEERKWSRKLANRLSSASLPNAR